LGPDLQGFFNSRGHNFVGRGEDNGGFSDALGDIVGSAAALSPLLGPLADNGGQTFTRALLQGSPALDAGDDSLQETPLGLLTDQRGFFRKSGVRVDIGAYELQCAATPIRLAARRMTDERTIELTVTNVPGASITVVCTTNLSQSITMWTSIGSLRETTSGQFQFTETLPTNSQHRFYRVRSP
jgi:hypothetical protein